MRRLGPILGRERAANCEDVMIAAVMGRNANPARRGL
jgi:hypothetical protein